MAGYLSSFPARPDELIEDRPRCGMALRCPPPGEIGALDLLLQGEDRLVLGLSGAGQSHLGEAGTPVNPPQRRDHDTQGAHQRQAVIRQRVDESRHRGRMASEPAVEGAQLT
jgi:hypothetical protein